MDSRSIHETENRKDPSDKARSHKSNIDFTERQGTLELELKVQSLEEQNKALMSEINTLKEEAKIRGEEGEFTNTLVQSPLKYSDTMPYFDHPNRGLTDKTVYDNDKPEIEEEEIQEKNGKNQASTHLNDIFTAEDINKGRVTSWALYQFHKRCQEYVREELKKVDHLSSVKVADIGLEIVAPEDPSKYIKNYIRKDTNPDTITDTDLTIAIVNMERDLKSSANFRKKGEKSLNYMVKRANDHELGILASLTVAHLKKLANIPDEKIPDIWKKVHEFYREKRYEGLGELDGKKFTTLKRYIERQRVNEKELSKRIWGRAFILSSYIDVRQPRFWITKRDLKQELAISFGLEKERDDFLKEKEARKSDTGIKNMIRKVRGYRPHDQRIERPRGRYGKEQGKLREIIRFKEKYQRAIDDIQQFQLENDFVYQKIERHITDLCKKCQDPEHADKAFKALADYKTIVTNEGERLNRELNKLHLQFTGELQGMEKRITGILEKVTWNDFFSIGYGPAATTAGTVLTVLPFAGV